MSSSRGEGRGLHSSSKAENRYSSNDNLLDDDSIPSSELQRVTCFRCNKLYDNPVQLPCLHAVCNKCYQILTKEAKPVCPECQEDVKVIKSNTPAKVDHVMLRAVGDIQFLRKVTGKQDVHCERCALGKIPFAFCTVCTKFLCDHCSKDHNLSIDTRDHQLEKMADLKTKVAKSSKSSSSMPKMPRGQKSSHATTHTNTNDCSMCTEHGKELEFYCTVCQELGCYRCMMGDHIKKGHDYISVDEDLFKKERKAIEAEVVPLNELIKRYQEATTTFDSRIAQLRSHANTVRKAIQDATDKLHKAVDARKDTLMTQVDNTQKVKLLKMQEQLERVKTQTQKLVASRDVVTYTLQTGNMYEILQTRKSMVSRLEQLRTGREVSDSLIPEESIWLKFSEPEARELDSLQDVIGDFGHIADGAHGPHCTVQFPAKVKEGEKFKIQVTAMDKFDRLCSNEKEAISAILRPENGKAMRGRVSEASHGIYHVTFEGKLPSKVILLVTVARENVKDGPFMLEVGKDGTLSFKGGVSVKMDEKKQVRFSEGTKPPSEGKPSTVHAQSPPQASTNGTTSPPKSGKQ